MLYFSFSPTKKYTKIQFHGDLILFALLKSPISPNWNLIFSSKAKLTTCAITQQSLVLIQGSEAVGEDVLVEGVLVDGSAQQTVPDCDSCNKQMIKLQIINFRH